MKVTTEKAFRPITFTVTVESKEELVELWGRLNLSLKSVKDWHVMWGGGCCPPNNPDKSITNAVVALPNTCYSMDLFRAVDDSVRALLPK